MSSGVQISQACIDEFFAMKKSKKYRYLVFHIPGEKVIEVECKGDRSASYEEFVKLMTSPNDDVCRYGVFDYEYTYCVQGAPETKKEKMFLVSYCGENSPIRLKMLYSSSYDAFKSKMDGVGTYIQTTTTDELADQKEIECKLKKNERI